MPEHYNFGPFRFSIKDMRLWKGPTQVSLRPQSAKLLKLLLDRNGRPVSRAEMETHLWPKGVSREADVGQQLTSGIWHIRQALCDKAKAPVYVASQEDGYVFIAPVQLTGGDENDLRPSTLDEDESHATPSTVTQDPRLAQPASRSDGGHAILAQELRPTRAGATRPYGLWAMQVASLIATWLATDAAAFGTAIVCSFASGLVGILLYNHVEDAPISRFSLAVLIGAIIGYAPTVATLTMALASVVNATTLKTAPLYPYITGLHFVPLYLVVLASWVGLAWCNDQGFRQRRAFRNWYLFIGAIVLCATVFATIIGSGQIEIWKSAVPGRRTLLGAYTVIIAMNVAVWAVGFRHFDRTQIDGYAPLFVWALGLYLPLAFAAFVAGREFNFINRHYLDQRRPQVYLARNPGGIVVFKSQKAASDDDIGPDLRSLMNAPDFERNLPSQRFYKQDFDEAFQVPHKAEMFGFRVSGQTYFTIVRFPKRVTEALRFEAVLE